MGLKRGKMKRKKKIINMVTLAILMAFVIVLQLFGSSIHIGEYGFSLVGIPVVVGAILLGPSAGLILGFTFSFVVMFSADTQLFIGYNLFYTIIVVFGKGMLAGWISGLLFKAFKNIGRNKGLAYILAAFSFPIINTGVFAIGTMTLFYDILIDLSSSSGANAFIFLFTTMIGINFFVEFTINVVLSPVIARICKIGEEKLGLNDIDD